MTMIVRPEPFSTDLSRFFDAVFEPSNGRRAQTFRPPVDLVEAQDHFVLKADLPGLSEDDVSIEVQDGVLKISGERRDERREEEKGWFRVERSFGSFSRSLTLPEGVDPDAIQANFDSGVLEVRIPKPEERKPRRIEIRATNGAKKPADVEGEAK